MQCNECLKELFLMKGSEVKLLEYLEGASKRYVIPVYQRKYDWKQDNCRQLYDDLKKTIRECRASFVLASMEIACSKSAISINAPFRGAITGNCPL